MRNCHAKTENIDICSTKSCSFNQNTYTSPGANDDDSHSAVMIGGADDGGGHEGSNSGGGFCGESVILTLNS